MEKTDGDSITLPNFSDDEIRVLQTYYNINKKYRDEINHELQQKLQDHPVFGPMMKAMTPEMQRAQQERSDAMQYAAIFEGKWQEYANDLMAQGRMYARMNVSYTDWYELIALAKNMIMPRVRRDFKDDVSKVIDFNDGMSKFLDYAMYGIAEAYFQEKNDIIRQNEEKFTIVFKNSKDYILLINRDGEVLAVNHEDQYPDELKPVGLHVNALFGQANIATLEHALQLCIDQKISTSFDTEVMNGNTVMHFQSTVSPVVGEDNMVKASVIIARDITEQKRAELELHNLNLTLETKVAQRTEELNIINKELESFTYSVSHDLRSPLRAINGFSEILKLECGDSLNEDAQDALREILKNTRKMARLIDNLLEFSRLGKQHVSRANVDMEELFTSVIEETKSLVGRNVEFALGKLPRVNGDRSMLKQVAVNLISNAVKYSSKKPNPAIEIGADKNNGEIIYYVKDNGAGFNMKYYDKLFGIFQRLHGSDEFEGIGVGLAIVQRVIVRHHGKVWAEGTEGEGATFYFSLPTTEYSN